MPPEIEQALNDLIAREAQGSANYFAAIQVFQSNNLQGYVNWLNTRLAPKSERIQKIHDYLIAHGKISNPTNPTNPTYNNPLEALKSILCYDYDTTDKARWTINEAISLNDDETAVFVRGLVDEQTEEEATASELLERTRKAYNHHIANRLGLSLIDDEYLI